MPLTNPPHLGPSFPKIKDDLAPRGWGFLPGPESQLPRIFWERRGGGPLRPPCHSFPASFLLLSSAFKYVQLSPILKQIFYLIPPTPTPPPPCASGPSCVSPAVTGDLLGRAGLIHSGCPRGPGSCLLPPPLPGSAPSPQSLGLAWWDPGGIYVPCRAWRLFSPTSGTPQGLVPVQGELWALLGAL